VWAGLALCQCLELLHDDLCGRAGGVVLLARYEVAVNDVGRSMPRRPRGSLQPGEGDPPKPRGIPGECRLGFLLVGEGGESASLEESCSARSMRRQKHRRTVAHSADELGRRSGGDCRGISVSLLRRWRQPKPAAVCARYAPNSPFCAAFTITLHHLQAAPNGGSSRASVRGSGGSSVMSRLRPPVPRRRGR
jgi:hypothetical protein